MVRNGNRRGVLDKMMLRGADINFVLAMTLDGAGLVTHTFSGKAVSDNEITGTVKMQRIVNEETIVTEVPWRAVRAATSAYFSPTGPQPAQAMEPAKAGGGRSLDAEARGSRSEAKRRRPPAQLVPVSLGCSVRSGLDLRSPCFEGWRIALTCWKTC